MARKSAVVPVTTYIRWMIRRDYEEILAIEQQGRDPWTEDQFLTALRQRNVIGWVAEQGEEIVGHMVYEMHKSHMSVLRVAAKDGCSTVLGKLLAKVVTKLCSRRRTRVKLDVDERDLNMHLLLKGNGWEASRIIYATDGGYDKYRFVFSVPAASTVEVSV